MSYWSAHRVSRLKASLSIKGQWRWKRAHSGAILQTSLPAGSWRSDGPGRQALQNGLQGKRVRVCIFLCLSRGVQDDPSSGETDSVFIYSNVLYSDLNFRKSLSLTPLPSQPTPFYSNNKCNESPIDSSHPWSSWFRCAMKLLTFLSLPLLHYCLSYSRFYWLMLFKLVCILTDFLKAFSYIFSLVWFLVPCSSPHLCCLPIPSSIITRPDPRHPVQVQSSLAFLNLQSLNVDSVLNYLGTICWFSLKLQDMNTN